MGKSRKTIGYHPFGRSEKVTPVKRIVTMIKVLIILLGVVAACLYFFDYKYIFKGIRVVYLTGHTMPFIEDTPYFDSRDIKTEHPKPLEFHRDFNLASQTKELIEFNKKLGTSAYLILRKGKIWHEWYADDFDQNSLSNSFSMAKSITSALMFKAIEDRYIKSLDSKVIDFFPELKGKYAHQVTVGDLSSMASGLNWNEHYSSPFSVTARANYQKEIRSLILDLEVLEAPGQEFNYLSGATQLLGMVIEKATQKTLSDYLSETFWKPMQMTNDGKWQLDSFESGIEKAFCCVASTARDFAKWGLLWNNKGVLNGKQILSQQHVALASSPRFEDYPHYGYGFWLSDCKHKKISYMRGIMGQYVISIPEDDLVIVRLGHKRSMIEANRCPGKDFYVYLDAAYDMIAEIEK